MRYVQLRNQVRQLWADHHGGVPCAPVSYKTWLQTRASDALMEYTDRNAKELYKHLSFDFNMDPIEATQFEDWIDFARQYGFAVKLDAEGAETT